MRYYIDTCIWIDFIKGRTDDDFISRCILNEDTIIYSYPLEKELLRYIDPTRIKMIYALLSAKELIEYVKVDYGEKREALRLSQEKDVPFADALHAILSRDNDAVIVTRDKHFITMRDVVDVILL